MSDEQPTDDQPVVQEQKMQDGIAAENASDNLTPSPVLPPTPPVESVGAPPSQETAPPPDAVLPAPTDLDRDHARRHMLQPALYGDNTNEEPT